MELTVRHIGQGMAQPQPTYEDHINRLMDTKKVLELPSYFLIKKCNAEKLVLDFNDTFDLANNNLVIKYMIDTVENEKIYIVILKVLLNGSKKLGQSTKNEVRGNVRHVVEELINENSEEHNQIFFDCVNGNLDDYIDIFTNWLLDFMNLEDIDFKFKFKDMIEDKKESLTVLINVKAFIIMKRNIWPDVLMTTSLITNPGKLEAMRLLKKGNLEVYHNLISSILSIITDAADDKLDLNFCNLTGRVNLNSALTVATMQLTKNLTNVQELDENQVKRQMKFKKMISLLNRLTSSKDVNFNEVFLDSDITMAEFVQSIAKMDESEYAKLTDMQLIDVINDISTYKTDVNKTKRKFDDLVAKTVRMRRKEQPEVIHNYMKEVLGKSTFKAGLRTKEKIKYVKASHTCFESIRKKLMNFEDSYNQQRDFLITGAYDKLHVAMSMIVFSVVNKSEKYASYAKILSEQTGESLTLYIKWMLEGGYTIVNKAVRERNKKLSAQNKITIQMPASSDYVKFKLILNVTNEGKSLGDILDNEMSVFVIDVLMLIYHTVYGKKEESKFCLQKYNELLRIEAKDSIIVENTNIDKLRESMLNYMFAMSRGETFVTADRMKVLESIAFLQSREKLDESLIETYAMRLTNNMKEVMKEFKDKKMNELQRSELRKNIFELVVSPITYMMVSVVRNLQLVTEDTYIIQKIGASLTIFEDPAALMTEIEEETESMFLEEEEDMELDCDVFSKIKSKVGEDIDEELEAMNEVKTKKLSRNRRKQMREAKIDETDEWLSSKNRCKIDSYTYRKELEKVKLAMRANVNSSMRDILPILEEFLTFEEVANLTNSALSVKDTIEFIMYNHKNRAVSLYFRMMSQHDKDSRMEEDMGNYYEKFENETYKMIENQGSFDKNFKMIIKFVLFKGEELNKINFLCEYLMVHSYENFERNLPFVWLLTTITFNSGKRSGFKDCIRILTRKKIATQLVDSTIKALLEIIEFSGCEQIIINEFIRLLFTYFSQIARFIGYIEKSIEPTQTFEAITLIRTTWDSDLPTIVTSLEQGNLFLAVNLGNVVTKTRTTITQTQMNTNVAYINYLIEAMSDRVKGVISTPLILSKVKFRKYKDDFKHLETSYGLSKEHFIESEKDKSAVNLKLSYCESIKERITEDEQFNYLATMSIVSFIKYIRGMNEETKRQRRVGGSLDLSDVYNLNKNIVIDFENVSRSKRLTDKNLFDIVKYLLNQNFNIFVVIKEDSNPIMPPGVVLIEAVKGDHRLVSYDDLIIWDIANQYNAFVMSYDSFSELTTDMKCCDKCGNKTVRREFCPKCNEETKMYHQQIKLKKFNVVFVKELTNFTVFSINLEINGRRKVMEIKLRKTESDYSLYSELLLVEGCKFIVKSDLDKIIIKMVFNNLQTDIENSVDLNRIEWIKIIESTQWDEVKQLLNFHETVDLTRIKIDESPFQQELFQNDIKITRVGSAENSGGYISFKQMKGFCPKKTVTESVMTTSRLLKELGVFVWFGKDDTMKLIRVSDEFKTKLFEKFLTTVRPLTNPDVTSAFFEQEQPGITTKNFSVMMKLSCDINRSFANLDLARVTTETLKQINRRLPLKLMELKSQVRVMQLSVVDKTLLTMAAKEIDLSLDPISIPTINMSNKKRPRAENSDISDYDLNVFSKYYMQFFNKLSAKYIESLLRFFIKEDLETCIQFDNAMCNYMDLTKQMKAYPGTGVTDFKINYSTTKIIVKIVNLNGKTIMMWTCLWQDSMFTVVENYLSRAYKTEYKCNRYLEDIMPMIMWTEMNPKIYMDEHDQWTTLMHGLFAEMAPMESQKGQLMTMHYTLLTGYIMPDLESKFVPSMHYFKSLSIKGIHPREVVQAGYKACPLKFTRERYVRTVYKEMQNYIKSFEGGRFEDFINELRRIRNKNTLIEDILIYHKLINKNSFISQRETETGEIIEQHPTDIEMVGDTIRIHGKNVTAMNFVPVYGKTVIKLELKDEKSASILFSKSKTSTAEIEREVIKHYKIIYKETEQIVIKEIMLLNSSVVDNTLNVEVFIDMLIVFRTESTLPKRSQLTHNATVTEDDYKVLFRFGAVRSRHLHSIKDESITFDQTIDLKREQIRELPQLIKAISDENRVVTIFSYDLIGSVFQSVSLSAIAVQLENTVNIIDTLLFTKLKNFLLSTQGDSIDMLSIENSRPRSKPRETKKEMSVDIVEFVKLIVIMVVCTILMYLFSRQWKLSILVSAVYTLIYYTIIMISPETDE